MARRLSPLYVEPVMPRWWDRSVILLTLAALVLLVVDMGFEDPSSELARTVGWIDLAFCTVFVIDFAVRYRRATHKWRFVKRNWVDLLGSIPLVGPLRTARAIRLVRLVRLTRIAALTRRVMRRYDIPVPGRALWNLALVTAFIWLGAGGLFYYFEHGVNEGIVGLDDAMWWSMTTLSTVGYGDLYPESTGGRVVAITTMILGIGVLGTLAATLATALIDIRERGRRGTRSYMLKDHVLVLGWNDKSLAAIDEFRHDPRYERTPLCVVAELEETPVEDGQVRFVRGQASHREPLKRAAADRAAAAMVFATDPGDPRSDHETAVVVHTLRRLNPKLQVSAELVDPSNRDLLVDAGCDSVVDLNGVASALITRSVQDLGVSDVVNELLSNKEGCEIYRVPVGEELIGKNWRQFVHAMIEQEVTPLGVVNGEGIRINPGLGYVMAKGDEVFVVSEEPPT